MDPVSQTLAQQQSGSAGGQGFGSFLAQGIQLRQGQQRLNQNQQQIGLANRRLQIMEAEEKRNSFLFPLATALETLKLKHEGARLGANVSVNLQNEEITTQITSMLPELTSLKMKLIQSGFQDKELVGKAYEMSQKNPWLFVGDAPGKEILDGIDGAQMFRHKALRALEIDKDLEKRGLRISGFQSNPQTGSLSVQVGSKGDSLTPNMKEANAITAIEEVLATETDPQVKASLERRLNNLRIQTQPASTTEVFDPQTGNPIMRTTTGRGASSSQSAAGLTPSQSGVLVQQATKLTDTTRKISKIVPLADKIFGPLAAGQSIVVDRMLANLVPGLAEGERIQGRAQAAAIINGVIQQLGEGQGQLSNRDVQRYEKIVPEIKEMAEMLESPENARQLMLFLQKEISRDAYTKYGLIGEPPPMEVLSGLDPDFLVEEVQAGRLTPDQLEEALMKSLHTDEIMKALSNLKNQK